jgi:RHS repeat-associated protein
MSPYNYNASNELTATPSGSYGYDYNGNTLSDPSGKSYSWDFENRLTQAVVPGTGTVNFKYDPFGRRIQKSSPLGTTNYLYDGDNLIEEMDANANALSRYTQGPGIDQLFAELRSGTVSYYQSDVLSTVTSLSNLAGTLANTYSYDAFGNLIGSAGTLINPFQYTGRDYDSETGLRYDRARYYDPRIGRFVSEDPARLKGGIDFYSYAANSPANFIDPFGFTPSCVMTSAGLQCTNNNPVNDQIDTLQALFPGSRQSGNSLNIPLPCDDVNKILENSDYYYGGPFTDGNWLTQNPFLFWDPIFHWGGSEWRSRSGFHFRRKYTFCNKNCTLDEFHIDSHNPMYDPGGHFQCDLLKGWLGGCS